jgi:hypothetical protein
MPKGVYQHKKRHGLSRTRFYRIWAKMKDRCNNKNNKYYSYYGGCGIVVCTLWEDFKEFKKSMYGDYLKHVAEFGEKNTTLDRITGGAGYIRDNCRWATRREQVLNTKRKVLIKYDGEIKPLSDWAKIFGLKYSTLYRRVIRDRWSFRRAISVEENV